MASKVKALEAQIEKLEEINMRLKTSRDILWEENKKALTERDILQEIILKMCGKDGN
jgi:hypothetical protein